MTTVETLIAAVDGRRMAGTVAAQVGAPGSAHHAARRIHFHR
jgi:hypothetical protein